MTRPNDQPTDRAVAVVAGNAAQPERVAAAVQTLSADLSAKSEQLAMALAGRYDARYFQSVALSQFRRSPALWNVVRTVQGRVSFVDAVVQAAQYGLPFLAGRAYLVPFANHGVDEAQLIVGYQGLVDLVTAPGTGVTFVEAAVVYERDTFEYQRGTNAFLRHVDYRTAGDDGIVDRGRPAAVWARVAYDNGQSKFDVFDVAKIEAVRRRSKAGQRGPWITDWDEMAKKTVLRNLCKTLRISLAVMEVIDREDELEHVPDAAPATAQTVLRQRIAQRLTHADNVAPPGSTTAAVATPEPVVEPITGPAPDPASEAVLRAAAANDAAVDDAVDGLWTPQPEPAPTRAQPAGKRQPCGDMVRGNDGTAYTCRRTAGHDGRHTDANHDWD